MKIGLVTTYRIDNYGTKLQAYAIQQALKKGDNEVVIINYYPAYDIRPKVLVVKGIRKLISFLSKNREGKCINGENAKRRHEAISSFDKYYTLSLPIKGYHKLKNIVSEYDCFVCGSDQIWAAGNNITDFYNLNFVDNRKPTISYAPSFGTKRIPKLLQNSYKKFLKQIDIISVRESSGVSLIENLIGRKVEQVLDPTLLIEKKIWDSLIKNDKYKIPYENYIFCYFLGKESSHREFAQKLSLLHGCKIINIAHMKGFCFADENFASLNLYDISPITFIRLIENAEYICTDSFHGTVFSIIFKKEFFTFERFKNSDNSSTNSRIYSLLRLLGLESRLVKNEISLPMALIDYNSIHERLNVERKKSELFLNNALNKIIGDENIR